MAKNYQCRGVVKSIVWRDTGFQIRIRANTQFDYKNNNIIPDPSATNDPDEFSILKEVDISVNPPAATKDRSFLCLPVNQQITANEILSSLLTSAYTDGIESTFVVEENGSTYKLKYFELGPGK